MESSLRTVEALQKRLDRMAVFCDVCPRETDSYRELQDFLGGSLESSPVLVALEHARVLEQPIRDACKRIERGVEAVEAEARCISMAWLCLQALAMQATGADLDFYWPRSDVGNSGGPDALLRLHLSSVDGGGQSPRRWCCCARSRSRRPRDQTRSGRRVYGLRLCQGDDARVPEHTGRRRALLLPPGEAVPSGGRGRRGAHAKDGAGKEAGKELIAKLIDALEVNPRQHAGEEQRTHVVVAGAALHHAQSRKLASPHAVEPL